MKISTRQFYFALAVLLAALCALNAIVAQTTRNSVPRREMALALQRRDASILAIGNSLIGAGFDEGAFDRGMKLDSARGAFNFSLGGSTPVEQLLFLRYALQHGIRPRLVIYGFCDLQMSTPVRLTTGDLIGNRAVLYYLEPEYARHFYSLSLHDRVEFEIMRRFPMMVDRGAFWAKIELMRRHLAQQGMPSERIDRFGRAGDFSLLEAANTLEFAQACDQAAARGFISPVDEIIRQTSDSGAKLVIVQMPMREAHLEAFYDTPAWKNYGAHVQNLVESKAVSYIDASHWIQDQALFADPLHLSDEGAAQFSERLGEYIRDHSNAN